jgi:hypothetical protein
MNGTGTVGEHAEVLPAPQSIRGGSMAKNIGLRNDVFLEIDDTGF